LKHFRHVFVNVSPYTGLKQNKTQEKGYLVSSGLGQSQDMWFQVFSLTI